MWRAKDNHDLMCHIMCIFRMGLQLSAYKQESIFHKIAPNLTYLQKS